MAFSLKGWMPVDLNPLMIFCGVNDFFHAFNDDSRNISDVALSIPLDAEGIFDLPLILDPNGTLLMADDDTASGNDTNRFAE
jgi:hypothetical protein